MVGWRIDPEPCRPIGLGRPVPAVGTVAMVQGKEIRNRLKASRRTADPGARSELAELLRRRTQTNRCSDVPAQPIVIVILLLAEPEPAGS